LRFQAKTFEHRSHAARNSYRSYCTCNPTCYRAGVLDFRRRDVAQRLTNRLGRIVDRARVVEAKIDFRDEAQSAKASEELIRLSTRARLVNFAISFCTISALLICITIATLFTGTFLPVNLSKLITVLFIAAMFSLFLA